MKALDRGQTPTITPDLTDELFIVQVDADGVARDGRASIGTLLEATASSQFVGRASDGSRNVKGAGSSALAALTSGTDCTAEGDHALAANTTGIGNVAVGSSALAANTTGVTNTAVGWNALAANLTGACIVAIGPVALYHNLADDNVAVGSNALYANTTGQSNTGIGTWALADNTTVSGLTAVGFAALRRNTTGTGNTAVGGSAAGVSTTASFLTAVGYGALFAATTGGGNTAIGGAALGGVTNGTDNVGIGNDVGVIASKVAVSGIRNTWIGTASGPNDTSDPSQTVAIGYAARTAGTYATAIGYATRATATGSVAIGCDSGGNSATTSTSNEIKLGTASHTTNIIGNASVGGSGKTLGFFGATPAAKPTGVAVSAAGVHAALVTLGLIAA